MNMFWLPLSSSIALLVSGISYAQLFELGMTSTQVFESGGYQSMSGEEVFLGRTVAGDSSLSDNLMVQLGDRRQSGSVPSQHMTLQAPGLADTPVSRALSWCDGGQVSAWVSYGSVEVTCERGYVPQVKTVSLPPLASESSLWKKNAQLTSTMLVEGSTDGEMRYLLDAVVIKTVVNAVLSMVGATLLSDAAMKYQVSSQSSYPDSWGKMNQLVVLKPTTDEEVMTSQKSVHSKGYLWNIPGIISAMVNGEGSDGKSKDEQTGDSGNQQGSDNPGNNPSGNPPGGCHTGGSGASGGGGGGGGGYNWNPWYVTSPFVVNVFHNPMNLEKLLEALQLYIVHASGSELAALELHLGGLMELVHRIPGYNHQGGAQPGEVGHDEVDMGEDVNLEGMTPDQRRLYERRVKAIQASRQLAETLPAVVHPETEGLTFMSPVLESMVSLSQLMNHASLNVSAEKRQRELQRQREQLQQHRSEHTPPPEEANPPGAEGGDMNGADIMSALLTTLLSFNEVAINVVGRQLSQQQPPIEVPAH